MEGLVQYISGDIANIEVLDRSTSGIDICIHAASTTVPMSAHSNMERDVTENLIGAIGVLRSCVRSGVKRALLVSSGGTVYGRPVSSPITEVAPTNPISAYGIVKLAIEKYFTLFGELYGLDYRIARLSNPYGPGQQTTSGQGVVAAFVERALKEQPLVVMGDGSIIRDFIYIEDAASALLKLCFYEGSQKIFNIGSGIGASINEIIAVIESASQLAVKVEYRPARKFDVPLNVLCCKLALRELGWSATTPLEAGLKATIDAGRAKLSRMSEKVAGVPDRRWFS